LEAHPDLLRDGFWELDLHRRLWAEGRRVTYVPAVRVTQQCSFGFRGFLAQRYEHGQQFGRARWAGRGWPVRLAAAAAGPLIPAVWSARVGARVRKARRHYGRFLLALPALACFIGAWSAGEVRGYLTPRRPERATRPGRSPAAAPVPELSET